MITDNSINQVRALGESLRVRRVEVNEPQESFAARLGVSVPTLRKMESGDPKVAAGVYFEAIARLFGHDAIARVSERKKSLFDAVDQKPAQAPRLRARRV